MSGPVKAATSAFPQHHRDAFQQGDRPRPRSSTSTRGKSIATDSAARLKARRQRGNWKEITENATLACPGAHRGSWNRCSADLAKASTFSSSCR